MKKFTFLILLLAASLSSFAQKTWTGLAGDGLWTSANNWSGVAVPGSTDDVILDNTNVSGAYSVTLPGNATATTIKSLQIGYNLNANLISLTISNAATATASVLTISGGGATALHIMDNGKLINNSSLVNNAKVITLAANTDFFKISGTGYYHHKIVGGNSAANSPALPSTSSADTNYDFGINSTVEIETTGAASTTLRTEFNRVANWGNLIITSVGQSINFYNTGGLTNTIKGNVTVSTNSVFTGGSGSGGTLIFEKDLIIGSGATFRAANGSGSQIITIKGDVSGDGTFNTITSTGTGLTQVTLEGSLNAKVAISTSTSAGQVAGSFIKFSGGTTNNVTFSGTADSVIKNIIIDSPKNVTLTSKATIPSTTTDNNLSTKAITINSGATLTIGATGELNTDIYPVSGAGTLVVNGKLGIGSLNATDAFAANVFPTTVTLNTGSTVVLNGSAAQNLGARTFKNLTLNNAAGATLKGAIGVDNLSITTGILNLGTFTSTSSTLDFAGTAQDTNKSYGSTSSAATNKDDSKFAGTGILNNAVTLSNKSFEAGTFKYYPNPVENVITLNYINTINTVEVINVLGQTVFASQPNTNSTQLDLGSLNKGIYILKVTSNGQTEGVRIYKK